MLASHADVRDVKCLFPWNPDLWNLECNSRNPEYNPARDWKPRNISSISLGQFLILIDINMTHHLLKKEETTDGTVPATVEYDLEVFVLS